jgi:hypothetical protein
VRASKWFEGWVAFVAFVFALCASVDARADEYASCIFEAPSPSIVTAPVAELLQERFSPTQLRQVTGKALEEAIRAARPAPLSIRNLVVTGDLTLDDLEIAGPLQIENVVVQGKLSLRDVHARKVSLARSRVQGALILDGLRTERAVDVVGSALCGGASALRLDVGSDLTVTSTRVCNDEPFAYKEHDRELDPTGPTFHLSRGRVGGDVRFDSVRQTCPLWMRAFRSGARIVLKNVELPSIPNTNVLEVLGLDTQGGLFAMNTSIGAARIVGLKGGLYLIGKTHLQGPIQIVDLSSGALYVDDCEVDDKFHVFDSNLSALNLDNSHFRGKVLIAGDKMLGLFSASNNTASAPWAIVGVTTGSTFELNETEFLCDKDCACDPESERCARNKILSIEARGGVSFYKDTFRRSTFIGNLHGITTLELSTTEVTAPLEIYSAHLSGTLQFSRVQVRAPLTLVDVQTSQLGIDAMLWAVPPEDVHFLGVQFKRLDLGQDDPAFARVFDFMDHVDYSRDVYESAALHIQHEGRADVARDLRLASARRELGGGRKAAGGVLRYVWKAFLYMTIGGGVAPERAFILLFGLLLLGSWLYRDRSRMIWRGRAEEPHYSSFWYTVDLLLPIMKLEEARDWSPRPTERARIYTSRMMRVIGFMMIPLLLAAATGLVH